MLKQCMIVLFVLLSVACSDEQVQPSEDITISQKGKIETQISVNGVFRDYLIHIPDGYTGEEPVPLVLVFHGFGGNMNASYAHSEFHALAEQENFIVVHPNGLSNRWNAVTTSNNADVSFVEELIDQLQQEFRIDASKIYSVGMSNGGYLSFLLACELSDKIAAIASVTGLMFDDVLNNCQPNRPIPILQIHGTKDGVVRYSKVNSSLNFWLRHNETDLTPRVQLLPNLDEQDGSTVQRFTYANGKQNVEVQHLKIINGGHSWPGYEGNMDIDASEEAWRFLSQYSLNGKIK